MEENNQENNAAPTTEAQQEAKAPTHISEWTRSEKMWQLFPVGFAVGYGAGSSRVTEDVISVGGEHTFTCSEGR